MTTLLKLPTELLLDIFRYLHAVVETEEVEWASASSSPSSSTSIEDAPRFGATESLELDQMEDIPYNSGASYRTLIALARTCRTLYPVARQILYEQYRAEILEPIVGYLRRLAIEPSLQTYVRHIHVTKNIADELVECRSYKEIWDDLRHVDAFPEQQCLSDGERAQLELASLVANAPNLESLHMEVFLNSMAINISPWPFRSLPIWLRPIIEVAQRMPTNTTKSARYHRLHALEIDMQMTYEPDLAYLFVLPGLRKLRMSDLKCMALDRDATDRWPVGAAISSLHTLELFDISVSAATILHMINSCKAISRFKCRWANEYAFGCAFMWCQEVVAGLEQHSQTLQSLLLDPAEDPDQITARIDEGLNLQPVDGLSKLHALQSLTTPLYVLTGKPERFYKDQGIKASDIQKWAETPWVRELFPPNLQSLSLIPVW
jgi:hypothetical protein